ncbi:hypothetical protein F2P81_015384 [Scophthalmus maximus]|uniref:Uncharacterized protein n=1 Tax=Scophthalmus maximus TaxID=52904 RepID=A0A6A4SPV2_SCOMX|nr:hypothetical protein F2P81_015384 [Scophthalmus maximus]
MNCRAVNDKHCNLQSRVLKPAPPSCGPLCVRSSGPSAFHGAPRSTFPRESPDICDVVEIFSCFMGPDEDEEVEETPIII